MNGQWTVRRIYPQPLNLTYEGIISWMSLPAVPCSGIWMHVAWGSHTYQEGGMERLALPACTGTGIQKSSWQWLACFHSAAKSSFLVGCMCPVDQVNVNCIGWNDLLTMERQEEILGSSPIKASFNVTTVYGSIFYEQNEYFQQIWAVLLKSHFWNAHKFPEGLQHWDTISYHQFS